MPIDIESIVYVWSRVLANKSAIADSDKVYILSFSQEQSFFEW